VLGGCQQSSTGYWRLSLFTVYANKLYLQNASFTESLLQLAAGSSSAAERRAADRKDLLKAGLKIFMTVKQATKEPYFLICPP
jgi:hypothetical protein